MRLRPRVAIVALAFIAPALCAQSSAELIERLRLAAAASSLDSPGSAPIHLKANVSLEAQFKRPAEQGTIEVWYAAPRQRRVTYDFPSYQATVLQSSEGLFRSPNAGSPPFLVGPLLDELIHPMPPTFDPAKVQASLQKHELGKASVDCIALSPVHPSPSGVSSPSSITYCLTPNGDLRLILLPPYESITRETLGTLRELRPATQISIAFSGRPAAHAHVLQLTTRPNPYPETSDTTGLLLVPNPPESIAGSVIAGKILSKQSPIYPEMARQRHISGSVLLHAQIGADGRITELEVIGSPDDSLSEAAMEAVRQWVYQPYLLNGKPVTVDTTINVNFFQGRG